MYEVFQLCAKGIVSLQLVIGVAMNCTVTLYIQRQ